MATLRRPVMITWDDGQSHKQFGGRTLPPDLVTRCFQRMAVWVRLVTKSITAEFPSWELQVPQCVAKRSKLQTKYWKVHWTVFTVMFYYFAVRLNSFQAFNLQTPLPSDTTIQQNLRKLSVCFELNATQLFAEFYDFRRFALTVRAKLAPEDKIANYTAWKQSLDTCQAGRLFCPVFDQCCNLCNWKTHLIQGHMNSLCNYSSTQAEFESFAWVWVSVFSASAICCILWHINLWCGKDVQVHWSNTGTLQKFDVKVKPSVNNRFQ